MRHTTPRVDLDFDAMRFTVDGERRDVTGKPARLLRLLVEHRTRVVTADEIGQHLTDSGSFERTLPATNVNRLRKLLKNDALIRNIRGAGYQWDEEELSVPAFQVPMRGATSESRHVLAQEFFGGGPVRLQHIQHSLDIPRTQYIGRPSAANPEAETPWKNWFADQSAGCDDGPQVVAIVAPAGSGKTTLIHRILFDLDASGAVTIDALANASELPTTDHLAAVCSASRKVYCVTKLHDAFDSNECSTLAKWIAVIAKDALSAVLIVVADSNHWRYFETRYKSQTRLLSAAWTTWHLAKSLDAEEIRSLVSALRDRNVLRRRDGLTNEQLERLFTISAARGLLTSLIEVTRGSSEKETLSGILLREFEKLPQHAQWCYAVVSVCSAKNLTLRTATLQDCGENLGVPGDYVASVAFNRELHEVVVAGADGALRARHRLLANVLVASLSKYYPSLLRRVLLELLRVTAKEWPNLFQQLLKRRFLNLLRDDDSAQGIAEEFAGDLDVHEYDRARACEQILYMLRAHGRHRAALTLANASIGLWPGLGNPCWYVRAHLLVDTGSEAAAVREARHIIARSFNAAHIAQAAKVFLRTSHLKDAQRGIRIYEEMSKKQGKPAILLKALERDSIHLTQGDENSTRPSATLRRLIADVKLRGVKSSDLDSFARVLILYPFYRKAISSVATLVIEAAMSAPDENERFELLTSLERICVNCIDSGTRGEVAFPNVTLSVLHATAARAIHLRERNGGGGDLGSVDMCLPNFETAVALDPNNAWAKLWFAGFLRDARLDDGGAILLSRSALSLYPDVIIFVIGLAASLVRCGGGRDELLSEARMLLRDPRIDASEKFSLTKRALESEISELKK